jgi:hypothetical protein
VILFGKSCTLNIFPHGFLHRFILFSPIFLNCFLVFLHLLYSPLFERQKAGRRSAFCFFQTRRTIRKMCVSHDTAYNGNAHTSEPPSSAGGTFAKSSCRNSRKKGK